VPPFDQGGVFDSTGDWFLDFDVPDEEITGTLDPAAWLLTLEDGTTRVPTSAVHNPFQARIAGAYASPTVEAGTATIAYLGNGGLLWNGVAVTPFAFEVPQST
jgi:hypothetical protein